jgi:hypothetical protein
MRLSTFCGLHRDTEHVMFNRVMGWPDQDKFLLRAIDKVYIAHILYSLIARRRIRARLHGLWKILLYIFTVVSVWLWLLLFHIHLLRQAQAGGGHCCIISFYCWIRLVLVKQIHLLLYHAGGGYYCLFIRLVVDTASHIHLHTIVSGLWKLL